MSWRTSSLLSTMTYSFSSLILIFTTQWGRLALELLSLLCSRSSSWGSEVQALLDSFLGPRSHSLYMDKPRFESSDPVWLIDPCIHLSLQARIHPVCFLPTFNMPRTLLGQCWQLWTRQRGSWEAPAGSREEDTDAQWDLMSCEDQGWGHGQRLPRGASLMEGGGREGCFWVHNI